jgi:hypothetical protein
MGLPMRRVKIAFQTIRGLLTLADVLGTIGFWLYRGTMKRTLGIAIALLTIFMFGQKSDKFDFSFSTVMGGTGLILIISCIGGAILMFISGSFSKSVLRAGEAKGSNLLEDMKKARASVHCRRFWNRVFRYEQSVISKAQITEEHELIHDSQPELDHLSHLSLVKDIPVARQLELENIVASLGRSQEGWEIMFEHAMQLPLTRSSLKHQFRFDLSKMKDWYDGAPFHHSDTKLQEQFDAGESLQEAKKDARLTRFFHLTHSRKRVFQSLWFKIITRAIQLRVASACRTLDKRYKPFHFSPDQFLWPNPHSDALIRKELGEPALEDLVDLRQRVFQRVLNPEPELAQKLMHKAIYPNFDAAMQLRRLYDPEYVLGELDKSWSSDMVRYNRAIASEGRGAAKRRLFVQETRREQEALKVYLKTHPEINSNNDAKTLRALRIAVHFDFGGIKQLLLGKSVRDRSVLQRLADMLSARKPIEPLCSTEETIQKIIEEKHHLSKRLLGVRIHHELTRNELEDYEFYVNRIMHGYEVEQKTDAPSSDASSSQTLSDDQIDNPENQEVQNKESQDRESQDKESNEKPASSVTSN